MTQPLRLDPSLAEAARTATAWPFEEARKLVERVKRTGKTEVLFETGYGPSGLPHIGTFGEVARTSMVRHAFRVLTDDRIPTRLVAFSDDMDGLRKVPDNVPNQGLLAAHLGRPLTEVPDPFGTHESFAHHNNARLRAFLDRFGFDYEFLSSTDAYRSGMFDDALRRALQRFDEIQAVMLPTLGPDRRATYSPFLPISPTTGRVLQVPTLERNPEDGTIVFEDEDGTRVETPVTGGRVKLQWKPDWAMRWAALGVDYEMSGKDLIDSVKAASRICRILGAEPPQPYTFELFLDEAGAKISKSKGNGLGMEDWLRYGAPESLAFYMFQNPRAAKSLGYSVVPRAADDYLSNLDAYPAQEPAKRLDNPVWSVHAGHPPERGSPVSFGLLLNLASVANAADKAVLWRYLARYLPGATPEREPLLDQLTDYAVRYYTDFVAPTRRRRAPNAQERAAMADLRARLAALPSDLSDGETIQNEVYAVGKAHAFDPLRAWFQGLYEVLLGQSQGPRFGSFAAVYGLPETISLLDEALGGAPA
ncbi:MAG: lysine--tRNA ligase [Proteobacteria bacterium]|nr:lysine--tRNA ligase [Pseudomonadota bacterium]